LGKIDGINESFHRIRPRVLVYGAGAAGRQLVAALNVNKTMEVKGFIDDVTLLHGNSINGVVVFNPSQLNIIIESKNITDVILAIPSASQSDRNRIIERLTQIGVRVQSIPGLIDRRSGRILASDIKNLQMSDLLGRETVNLDAHLLKRKIKNRTVFITGAGGSIGSEICRQIVKYEPSTIVLLDNCEYALYLIEKELLKINLSHGVGKDSYENGGMIHIVPYLASVQDHDALECAVSLHMPDIVFHAAAYKHVSLVEKNPIEAIKNNVFGTLTCAKISIAHGVKNFILVSTDKAVRPTSIMGASKRISEMVLQALSDEHKIESSTIFSMVRFGNVLGSSGSVVPIFREQINQGGPITLTDLEVTRYFMTIPEAAQLVIQAYAMSLGGEVFVLDMGHPVKIYELAKKMINLSGHRVKSDLCPDGDIEIKVIGLRPGEKLFEELLIGEDALSTDHPKIMKAREEFLNWKVLESRLDEIRVALISGDMKSIEGIFKEIVHGYNRIF
jgi:FlaA1/EpsC-like NDP-sugar epimerase